MGSKTSKEEVIIAQTASGDATITKTDWILICLTVVLVILLLWLGIKKCKKMLRKVVRQEIHKNELEHSRDATTEA